MAYLPYSLTQANLNAIWLAENQATGKIKLQPDFDEETQKEVLTCYLLPQENLYPRQTGKNGLISLIFQIKTNPLNLETYISHIPENLSQYGNFGYNPSLINAGIIHTSESVKFATESENDEKIGNFVRTNTPHPKDLMKKKELLKLRNPYLISSNTDSKKPNKTDETSQRNLNTSRPSSFQAAVDQLPIINANFLDQEEIH